MKSDLKPFTIQSILNRFKEKDPSAATIHIQHFSVEFASIQLSKKMVQFCGGEEITSHEFTEYELSQLLDMIVNKYEHLIGRLASVRFMVDCQFETTKIWITF